MQPYQWRNRTRALCGSSSSTSAGDDGTDLETIVTQSPLVQTVRGGPPLQPTNTGAILSGGANHIQTCPPYCGAVTRNRMPQRRRDNKSSNSLLYIGAVLALLLALRMK